MLSTLPLEFGYSLVMIGFQGKWNAFHKTAETVFNRPGIASFSLCVGDQYLPAEIAAHLSYVEAERIADALQEVGAQIQIFPSDAVKGVLYREAECWPTRVSGEFHFSEVEGMILTLSPLNARENVRQLRARNPEIQPWQVERWVNHQHPTHESSRHGLRMAREMGEEIENALRAAYPDRGFVIAYRAEQVSFYQRGRGALEVAPKETAVYQEEIVYCETCNVRRSYQRIEALDPEFPNALWGTCCECGGEVLLETNEVLVIVEASEVARHQP